MRQGGQKKQWLDDITRSGHAGQSLVGGHDPIG